MHPVAEPGQVFPVVLHRVGAVAGRVHHQQILSPSGLTGPGPTTARQQADGPGKYQHGRQDCRSLHRPSPHNRSRPSHRSNSRWMPPVARAAMAVNCSGRKGAPSAVVCTSIQRPSPLMTKFASTSAPESSR